MSDKRHSLSNIIMLPTYISRKAVKISEDVPDATGCDILIYTARNKQVPVFVLAEADCTTAG